MEFLDVEAKVVRGEIIKILKRNYPYQTGDKLISDILLDLQYSVSPAVVSGYLTYMEEKGYVSVEKVKAYGVERVLAKLTPKGIDLMEGNIPADPGVKIHD